MTSRKLSDRNNWTTENMASFLLKVSREGRAEIIVNADTYQTQGLIERMRTFKVGGGKYVVTPKWRFYKRKITDSKYRIIAMSPECNDPAPEGTPTRPPKKPVAVDKTPYQKYRAKISKQVDTLCDPHMLYITVVPASEVRRMGKAKYESLLTYLVQEKLGTDRVRVMIREVKYPRYPTYYNARLIWLEDSQK